eukprot:6537254-Prorocentrum_lima.AAC.1
MESIGGEEGPGLGTMQKSGDDKHVHQLQPGAEGEGGVGKSRPSAEDTRLGQPGPVKGLGLHGDRGVCQQGAEVDIAPDDRHEVPMRRESEARRRKR